MQYPIIDNLTKAYITNGWTGLDIPQTITYEPIQLGIGDPSPDNIQPIEGTYIPSYGTVYGGTLDVTTGVLTVTHKKKTYIGSESWMDYSSYSGYYIIETEMLIGTRQSGLSNMLVAQYTSAQTTNGMWLGVANKYIFIIGVYNSMGATLEDFKIFLSTNNLEVVFPLATPITYQCTNEDINYLFAKYSSSILKLPLPHYFPHPVIDALQRAAAGTQTADDTEILRHYLTPLGIGGI